MNKFISVIAITAAALTATAAFAESSANEQFIFLTKAEQRALVADVWSQDSGVASQSGVTSQSGGPSANFIGITSVLRPETTGVWAGNYQGGRVSEPAGR